MRLERNDKDLLVMLSDIIEFFIREDRKRTKQYEVRIDQLFKCFIIEDWFGRGKSNKFYSLNKIIIKESIAFYHKC